MARIDITWQTRSEDGDSLVRVEFQVASVEGLPDEGVFVWQTYTDEASNLTKLPLRVTRLSDLDSFAFYTYPSSPQDYEIFRTDFYFIVVQADQVDAIIEDVKNKLQILVNAVENVDRSGNFSVSS